MKTNQHTTQADDRREKKKPAARARSIELVTINGQKSQR
jgi:hypothetical protein